MQFLGYMAILQGICIKNKPVKVVYNRPKALLIQDIQVFLGFADF